jgi:hypothetical protein
VSAAVITQAELTRRIKATVRAHLDLGLVVTGTRTTFANGEPIIEVTTSTESAQRPAPGGVNIDDFRKGLKERHAARRP